MNYLDILILEDDLGMVDLFETAVETWNVANQADDKSFNVIHAENTIQTRQWRFDGAIVDLRLPDENNEGSNPDNGNEFAASMVNARGIPVAVVLRILESLYRAF